MVKSEPLPICEWGNEGFWIALIFLGIWHEG
jgi:hypothetical protein